MVVYSDELCHWAKGSVGKNHKYLKREWKNGRWRYYYATAKPISLGLDERKALKAYEKTAKVTRMDKFKTKGNSIASEMSIIVGNPKEVYKERDAAYRSMREASSNIKKADRDIEQYSSNPRKLLKLQERKERSQKVDDARRKKYEATQAYDNAAKDYKEANDWISGHVDLQMKYNKTLLGQAEDKIKRGKAFIKSLF